MRKQQLKKLREIKSEDKSLFEKVCAILAEFTNVKVTEMKPNTNLLNDLDMNSLETMDAVIRFEEEFDIEIPDRDISLFRSIGDVTEYLSKKTNM